MAVNPIIVFFTRDLVPEYCQGLESSAVNTAPPFFVKSIRSGSNWRLPNLPRHMRAEEIIITFLMLIIYIGLSLPTALILTHLRPYETVEVMLDVRMNNSMDNRRIHNVTLLREVFPYRLAREIPPKDGVRYPVQSNARTPPHHLH